MSGLFRKKQTSQKSTAIQSPCIDICNINPDTELCEGCFRTVDEIAEWATYSDEEKLEILAAIEKRKAFFKKS